MSILNREFYDRDTLTVAKELLGCKLYRKIGDKTLGGTIIETEAYTADDPACHAYGKSNSGRAATMFKKPGIAYVYFIYGMYYCLNFVTEKEGTPGAVLIRALDNINGPGRLCRALQIDKSLNEADITTKNSGLWVEAGAIVPPENIITTTRIGIKKAVDYPWRFYIRV